MRFNYQNRSQSEGRVKDIVCGKPMLGIGEDDPRKWHPSSFFDETFCDCPEKAQEKSVAMSDEDWAEQMANEAVMPIIRSMYPSRSRGEMKNEFRHFLLTGIQYARSQERSRRDKLCEALKKISDPRLRDHKEPDSYTQLGCLMNIANEALAADDEKGKK